MRAVFKVQVKSYSAYERQVAFERMTMMLSERRIKDVLFYHQLDPAWMLEWRKILVGWTFLPHRCELSQEELWSCKSVLWGQIHVLPFLLTYWELRLMAHAAQNTNRKIHKNVVYSGFSEVFLNGAWAETCSLKKPRFPLSFVVSAFWEMSVCLYLVTYLFTEQIDGQCVKQGKVVPCVTTHASYSPTPFFCCCCFFAYVHKKGIYYLSFIFKKKCFQI